MPDPITTPTGRVVAPGGWRRAVLGMAAGMAAGMVHAVATRRDRARRPVRTRAPGAGR